VSRSAVGIILRAEWRAWRNRIAKANPLRVVGLVVFALLGGTVFGGFLFALAAAAGHLLPSARDAMLSGAFTALSVLMLVVGFPSVIATYFAGRDLMQLVLAPVRSIEIFLARSLFAMSANLLVAVVFLIFVAGVGAGSGASPLYYLLALALVFVQVLLVTALQATFMAAVLRWVPARIARDVAVAVASIAGGGLYLAWNLTLRQTLGSFAPRHQPDLSSLVSSLQRIEWVPSSWPGHALSAVIEGNASAALVWTGVTLVFAIVVVGAAALLYERTLLAGLGLLGGVPSRWRTRRRKPPRVAAAGAGSPGFAIARKDWIAYRRDIRRLSRFLPAMIFLLAYAVLLIRPGRGIDLFWNDVFVVAFVSLFMSMMFATTAIPAERRGYQLLRLAPVTSWQLIRAKVLFTLVPVLALTGVISLGLSLAGGNSPWKTLQVALLAVWLGVGCVCIGVSAGAIDPNFESADDRRSVGIVGTFAAMGGELAFGLFSVGALALFYLAASLAAGNAVAGLPVAATPAFAVASVVIAVALAAAGASVVVLMLWLANSHLRGFENSIVSN